jgi:hypothetical protein
LFISVDKFRQNLTWRIPMKIASILAGVAVAALTASAASAGDINRGEFNIGNATFGVQGGPGGPFNPANWAAAANNADAQWGASPISAWHAVGQSGANVGSVNDTGAATFTLKGKVATDCAYYTGSSTNQTLDFGTIGIYADENAGPANLFNMTQAASVEINSNVAGCNTANTVKISKTDLVSDNAGGYDSSVFTNKLPFSVTATYKAGVPNSAAAAHSQSWTVASGVGTDSKSHGAWKSPMSLNVNIGKPNQALLAGNYEGTVSVLISAN